MYIRGILIIVLFLLITFIIASIKTVKFYKKNNNQYLSSFKTSLKLNKTIQLIIDFASKFNYNIEYFDKKNKYIVLSDNISLKSYGFFYPIYINENEANLTIEIGLKSRLYQMGYFAKPYHKRLYNGLKAFFYTKNK